MGQCTATLPYKCWACDAEEPCFTFEDLERGYAAVLSDEAPAEDESRIGADLDIRISTGLA